MQHPSHTPNPRLSRTEQKPQDLVKQCQDYLVALACTRPALSIGEMLESSAYVFLTRPARIRLGLTILWNAIFHR
jgi:hypothetical protein